MTLSILSVTGSIDINWHVFTAHPGAIIHDRTAVHTRAVSPKGALVSRLQIASFAIG